MTEEELAGAALIVASWAFSIIVGMWSGIRLERYRIAQEEALYFEEDEETDAEYWKRMYEELAAEWDYEFKVKVLKEERERGETT